MPKVPRKTVKNNRPLPPRQKLNSSFLRWPGSKRLLMRELTSYLPHGKRLIEPFVGAGNVFINTDYPHYLLADINSDLINLYTQIKLTPTKVIDILLELAKKPDYYAIRDRFNCYEYDLVTRAAVMIFLNSCCYGGVWRYNRAGKLNSPQRPDISIQHLNFSLLVPRILLFASRLQGAEILWGNYFDTIEHATNGDVIYCDPPYLPIHSGSFTQYHQTEFSEIQHENLAQCLVRAHQRGAVVVVSASNTHASLEIYTGYGFIPHFVDSYRGMGDRRTAKEIIFTR